MPDVREKTVAEVVVVVVVVVMITGEGKSQCPHLDSTFTDGSWLASRVDANANGQKNAGREGGQDKQQID